jgi:hypothetical protein
MKLRPWAVPSESDRVAAYSRVHPGVHYPDDVIVGALIGSSIGEGVGLVAKRIEIAWSVGPKMSGVQPARRLEASSQVGAVGASR